MSDALEAFARFADFLPEPLLLVSGHSTIRAVNREARQTVFNRDAEVADTSLAAFFQETPTRIEQYLRMCSRSARPVPGVLRLTGEPSLAFRCSGWAIREEPGERFVLLRLTPNEPAIGRFLGLNQRIEQLTKEVALRLRAEHSAHEQREMLRVTLASIGDAVITTDIEGRVTFLNPVAEAHTGWQLQEALGRPLDEVFVIRNEVTRQPVENPVHTVLQTGRIVGLANHTVLIRRDGTELPIDDSGAPIRDERGRLIGVILVFHEVGERRKLERELRTQADALRKADKRKDEFLAMLAHELRNPLAPLHNCIQVLQNAKANQEDISALVGMMARQIGQLRRLVDDLLDISRITRGLIRLEKEPTRLSTIMEHAVEMVQPTVRERRHRLEISLPPDALVVDADLARLSQVISNLLTNAAKFMDPGGLIRITGASEGQHAVVRVRDYGVGLSDELLPRVFDLFSQGQRGLDREHGGLGIGLTLVKTLVEMHGGEVSAASEGTGKGSEFMVRLPITAAASKRPPENEPAPSVEVRRRVLIVDDNRDAAESLAMLLNASGCDVRSVYEGRAAINAVYADPPDAVLLDIGLPGMDGFEVARRLHRLPDRSRPLIIAVSGYGSEVDRDRAKEAGFDHHLTKPVDLEDLLELLA